ncbi:MAG: acyltransferase [Acidobacteria bacterium]|nr:acyltransferase [Acidobacteriota bacterium]
MQSLKAIAKLVARWVCVALVLPLATLTGFGRCAWLYTMLAQACALVPGLVGDYVRIAFYKLTLQRCALSSRISFGSFFAHREAAVGSHVYIGPYCILGQCRIGDRTQIASYVQVLSGRRQHARDPAGQIGGGVFEPIEIGADCWIGASSVIMATVGSGTTVGAGAVVVKELPPGVVAVGNPAQVIREVRRETA